MHEKSAHPENSFRLSLPYLRLGEFDLGGVLYHSNYFHLYEMAREEFLRANGLPYPELVLQGYHLTVSESHQTFFSPVTYGPAVEVFLWLTALKRASVIVNYEICLHDVSDETVLHRAWTKHVMVRQHRGGFKVASFTEPLTEIFTKFAICDAEAAP